MATVYTTVADVRAKLYGSQDYPISGRGVGTAADISDAQIETEIENAEGQIDSALAQRYPVPFDAGSVPSLVTQLTSDIAAYLSDLSYRGGAGRQYDSKLNPLALRYERAVALLERLRTAESDLPGQDELPDGEGGSTGGASVHNRYEGHLFDVGGWDVFGDPDDVREPVSTRPDGSRITFNPDWD